jgi:hypothetical protein
MEFKGLIMVKTIETGDETTTTIAGTTTIAQIAIETTIGCGEFPGLTNSSSQAINESQASSHRKSGTRLSHVHCGLQNTPMADTH